MSTQHSGRREDGFRIRKDVKFTPKPKPQKGWSHQDELKSAIGKQVILQAGESRFMGELLEADQFTLKVRVTNKTDSAFDAVLFKSAITYFVVQP